jgi:hypothetical protein
MVDSVILAVMGLLAASSMISDPTMMKIDLTL